jgi:hypothetical protein
LFNPALLAARLTPGYLAFAAPRLGTKTRLQQIIVICFRIHKIIGGMIGFLKTNCRERKYGGL